MGILQPENFSSNPGEPEGLTEKDRKLNDLAHQIDGIAHSLKVDTLKMIRVADSEIPDEPADVDTNALARVKQAIADLNRLVAEVEQTAGIIDIRPEQPALGEGIKME